MRRAKWAALCLGVALALFLGAGAALAGGVQVEPKAVTWDGMDLWDVSQVTAANVYLSFPQDAGFTEVDLTQCDGLVPQGVCTWQDDNHAGQIAHVRAVGTDGSTYSFDIRLATHVELGKYSQQLLNSMISLLQQILDSLKALPDAITASVSKSLPIEPTSPGATDLQNAVTNLQQAGVFGQVNTVATTITSGIAPITSGPAPGANGPTNYRVLPPGVTADSAQDSLTPCAPDEQARLSFCFPLRSGLHNEYVTYLHLDIANNVRDNWAAYDFFFRAIEAVLYVGFGLWLIRRFTPSLSA